jgi:hypothetical protein
VNKVLEFIGTTILKKVLHIAYNGKERDTLHVCMGRKSSLQYSFVEHRFHIYTLFFIKICILLFKVLL